MEELEYKIWFSKIGLSNKIKLELIRDFKNVKNIWNMKEKHFLQKGYTEKTILKIIDSSFRENLENDSKILEKNNVKLVSMYDSDFPKQLLEIPNCPVQIYYKGNKERLYEDNVAIIGSRRASDYGKNVARKMARDIAKRDVNVVSGLAIGIDKFAHLGALDEKQGKTIAVLGNGLSADVLYPRENYMIYKRIIEEGGVIVSEYPFFEKPCSYHFPERNRIISGISSKIIVVEANKKSGSLITVDFAIEQGKDVYAIPGNIDSSNSIGTNKLIQDGANPLIDAKEIFY